MKAGELVLIAALGLATLMSAAGDAAAQDAKACPDGAADTMLQVASQVVRATEETQLQNAFNYAKQLPAMCPEDEYVHYFAASTLLVITERIEDPNAKFARFGEAVEAFQTYDAQAEHGEDAFVSGLVDAAGNPIIVDLHRQSFDFMAEHLAPKVVWFEVNVLFHDWVSSEKRSDAEAAPCPYARQKFAAAEAYGHYLGHSQTAPIILENGQYPNPLGSTRRMEFLALACPDARTDITYQLGNMHVMFAEFIDARGSETGNGYIDLALEAIEAYENLAEGTPETEASRYTIAQRWKSEMLALKPAPED